jgi:hypothetical protein
MTTVCSASNDLNHARRSALTSVEQSAAMEVGGATCGPGGTGRGTAPPASAAGGFWPVVVVVVVLVVVVVGTELGVVGWVVGGAEVREVDP